MAKSVKVVGLTEVLRNLENWEEGAYSRLEDAMRYDIGSMYTHYAKRNRPWTDRTGQARARLHTTTYANPTEIVTRLHHGVSYGIYLELKHAGRFAILGPTVRDTQAEARTILRRAL